MKLNNILAASVLAGTVLLTGTACSGGNNGTQETQISQEEQQLRKESEETFKVAESINSYYDFISNPSSEELVKTAGLGLMNREVTDEELQTLVANFPMGFEHFDTSSNDKIKNAYKALTLGTANINPDSNEILIISPPSGVTIDGDKATYNTTYITVRKNGENLPTKPDPESKDDLIDLVKNSDGKWVIVAKESSLDPTTP